MLRLSSNLTLTLRIAIPCIYASFFGLFTIAVWFVDTNMPLLSNPIFKISLLVVYLCFLLLMYLTLLRLRRVEYLDEHLYVSSYLKNVRYAISDIESLTEYNLGFALIVRITLKDKGVWGKKLYFLAKSINYRSFIEAHTHLLAR